METGLIFVRYDSGCAWAAHRDSGRPSMETSPIIVDWDSGFGPRMVDWDSG